jgi:hypothetical protein
MSGNVLIRCFQERGCARSVSRSRRETLRLVSDTAAVHSNQDTKTLLEFALLKAKLHNKSIQVEDRT